MKCYNKEHYRPNWDKKGLYGGLSSVQSLCKDVNINPQIISPRFIRLCVHFRYFALGNRIFSGAAASAALVNSPSSCSCLCWNLRQRRISYTNIYIYKKGTNNLRVKTRLHSQNETCTHTLCPETGRQRLRQTNITFNFWLSAIQTTLSQWAQRFYRNTQSLWETVVVCWASPVNDNKMTTSPMDAGVISLREKEISSVLAGKEFEATPMNLPWDDLTRNISAALKHMAAELNQRRSIEIICRRRREKRRSLLQG